MNLASVFSTFTIVSKGKPALSFIVLLLLNAYVFGQNAFDLWAIRVNWDGRTPWKYYLNVAPASMGPNALIVPQIRPANLEKGIKGELGGAYHWMDGDETYNTFARVYWPLGSKIAVEASLVPREWYTTSPAVRDERNARELEGATSGDLYLNFLIQLLEDHSSLPDIQLETGLKTASGGDLRNARYNDAAGYYFMLSLGKSWFISPRTDWKYRIYGAGGFYVWQIYTNDQQQNDAPAYGAGISISSPLWEVDQQLAGYSGYIGRGDRPLVYRAELSRNFDPLFASLVYQKGIHDFPFQSVMLTMGISISE